MQDEFNPIIPGVQKPYSALGGGDFRLHFKLILHTSKCILCPQKVWKQFIYVLGSIQHNLLIEAIRFKVEQRMEGACKDRLVIQNTLPRGPIWYPNNYQVDE